MKTPALASPLALAGLLLAPVTRASAPDAHRAEEPFGVTRASDLLRLVLLTPEGEPLARVEDLVIERGERGAIVAVVLALDARVATERPHVAVPLDLLRPVHAIPSGSLVVAVDPRRLASAPVVTDALLARVDRSWSEHVRAHFDLPPLGVDGAGGADRSPVALIRLRQVLGLVARDEDGRPLAEIVDSALDVPRARVRHAVLAGPGEALLRAVPWDEVSVADDLSGVGLPMTAEDYSALAGFEPTSWPERLPRGG